MTAAATAPSKATTTEKHPAISESEGVVKRSNNVRFAHLRIRRDITYPSLV